MVIGCVCLSPRPAWRNPGSPVVASPAMAEDRELDVVVYGATGFVGRLTAEYLAAHAAGGRPHRARAAARASRGSRRSAPRWARRGRLAADRGRLDATPRRCAALAARTRGGRDDRRARTRPTAWSSSRPAPRPARTTPTSPARCCSCARRSIASTRSPPGRARGSCTPAASTRSRRTSACSCSPRPRARRGAGELEDTTLSCGRCAAASAAARSPR